MKYIYRLYQVFIGFPVLIISTVITSVVTMAGCFLGNGNFWGYYPAHIWGKVVIRTFLLPLKIEGRENMQKGQSYVFVANHQGAFDIFLIYGYLNRNFKWMMKRGIRNIPFVGIACKAAHHIFVDKSGPSKVKQTYDMARQTLKDGMSLMVFPEGARSFTGHMGIFRRGAFMLADELQLPVVPITINGSFNVLPRMKDGRWITWHPLKLTIHKPIEPIGQGAENVNYLLEKSYEAVMSSLDDKYRGYVENPDQ